MSRATVLSVPHDTVHLRQLAGFFHQLVYMSLVCGCNKCEVIKKGGYLPGRDHIFCAIISNLSCAQLLGELHGMIFVHRNS